MLLLVVVFAVDDRGLLSRRWIHLYFVHMSAHVPDTTRYALFLSMFKMKKYLLGRVLG